MKLTKRHLLLKQFANLVQADNETRNVEIKKLCTARLIEKRIKRQRVDSEDISKCYKIEVSNSLSYIISLSSLSRII